MCVQIIVLGIPDQEGGMPLHIVLLLRLFRMWHVIKFLEVSAIRTLATSWALVPSECTLIESDPGTFPREVHQ